MSVEAEARVLEAMPPLPRDLKQVDPMVSDARLTIGEMRADLRDELEGTSVLGYYSPDSPSYRVHENPVLVTGKNMIGFTTGIWFRHLAAPTIASMQKANSVTGRLGSTAGVFDVETLGTREEADVEIDATFVRHVWIHEWLKATLSASEA
jgi:hypothetical protein